MITFLVVPLTVGNYAELQMIEAYCMMSLNLSEPSEYNMYHLL
jgi:hypothetical protein